MTAMDPKLEAALLPKLHKAYREACARLYMPGTFAIVALGSGVYGVAALADVSTWGKDTELLDYAVRRGQVPVLVSEDGAYSVAGCFRPPAAVVN